MTDTALGRLAIRNQYFNRFLIPIILLAVCAWVGQATPNFHLANFDLFTIIVGGLSLAVFTFLTLRNLQIGLLAIVLSAFFIRFGLGTGTGTRIPASMLLAGLLVVLWILSMLVGKKLRLAPSSVNLPLFGFIIISFVSLPWSWLFSRPDLFLVSVGSGTAFPIVQAGGLALMVFLPLLFFLGLNVLTDRRWIISIFSVVILVGVIALVPNLTHISLTLGLLNVNTGGLFPLWIIALSYSQFLFNDKLRTWQRLLLGLLALGWAYYQFRISTTWFSGWMPAMVAVMFLTFRRSRKAAVLALIALAIPVLLDPLYFYDKIWIKAQLADFNRFTIWPTVISLTLTHASAIFGAGPVGYIPLYRTFVVGPAFSAHNNYVDIFSETGIVGFCFFIWFLLSTFRTGWSLDSKLRDGFLRGFNNGVLAAFVGTLLAMVLGDWFIPFVYNIGYAGFDYNAYAWIMLGAMVGLQRMASVGSTPGFDADSSRTAAAMSG